MLALSRPPTSSLNSPRTDRAVEAEVTPYVVVSDISGVGRIYKGYHEGTHRPVAIKIIKRTVLTAEMLINLQSETDILKLLSHRHVNKLIEMLEGEQNIYLITDFCSGGTLANYIKERGRVKGLEYIPSPGSAPQYYPHPRTGGLDEVVVRSFLRQLASALEFLWRRNLTHGDIQPQTILLDAVVPEKAKGDHPSGVPFLQLSCFRFTQTLVSSAPADSAALSLYVAPEVLRQEKYYESEADLWSTGVVLYEMAVGRVPFRAGSRDELLRKIEQSRSLKFPEDDSQATRTIGPFPDIVKVPEDIKRLIKALLKRNRLERASFEDFLRIAFSTSGSVEPCVIPSARAVPSLRARAYSVTGAALSMRSSWSSHVSVSSLPRTAPEFVRTNSMTPPRKFSFKCKNRLNSSSQLISDDGSSCASPASSIMDSSLHGCVDRDAVGDEYVLVGDSPTVEFNRAVDAIQSQYKEFPFHNVNFSEICTDPRRPLEDRIQPAYCESPSTESPSNATVVPRTSPNALHHAINMATKRLVGALSLTGPTRASLSPLRTQFHESVQEPLIVESISHSHDEAEAEHTLANALPELPSSSSQASSEHGVVLAQPVGDNISVAHAMIRSTGVWQRFASCVYNHLERCRDEDLLESFRTAIPTWWSDDTLTKLETCRSIYETLWSFLRSSHNILPLLNSHIRKLFGALQVDTRSICSQLAIILRHPASYKDLLARRSNEAQDLLDLLQNLLDWQPLKAHWRRQFMTALIRLSKASGLYPECLVVSGIQMYGEDPIAAGHFGEVYKGKIHGRDVAIKVPRVYVRSDTQKLLRDFSREVVIWQQLSHPNILPFLGVYHLNNNRTRVCFISPWMERGNVTLFLKNFPETKRFPLVLDVARGLKYLHCYSPCIIHGDLKGVNVLITPSGHACLADFGLAATTDSEAPNWTSLSTAAPMGGTMRWQAPELLDYESEDVDRLGHNTRPSDIYSFACVCYEIFSGKIPFHGLHDNRIMSAVTKGKRPERPSSAELDEATWLLIEDCWHMLPAARPTATEVVTRLCALPQAATSSPPSDWDDVRSSPLRYSLEAHPFCSSAADITGILCGPRKGDVTSSTSEDRRSE